jgi:hypothetical protein
MWGIEARQILDAACPLNPDLSGEGGDARYLILDTGYRIIISLFGIIYLSVS